MISKVVSEVLNVIPDFVSSYDARAYSFPELMQIRKFNKNLPILALSGAVFMEVKDKINECGMNGFIYKPFNPEDLLNKIEAAVI